MSETIKALNQIQIQNYSSRMGSYQKDLFGEMSQLEAQKFANFPGEKAVSVVEKAILSLSWDKLILCILLNMVGIVLAFSLGYNRGVKFSAGFGGVVPVMEKVKSEQTGMFLSKQNPAKRAVQNEQAKETVKQDVNANTPAAAAAAIPQTPLETEAQVQQAMESQLEVAIEEAVLPPKDGFTIQLVTYTDGKRAEFEVEKLKKNGLSSFVIKSGKYHQVCIEQFGVKAAAVRKLIELNQGGFRQMYGDAYVREVQR